MGRRERRGCRNWGESDFLPSGGSRKPFWMCVWAEIEGSAGFEYRKIGSYLEKYYFGSLDYTSNEIPSPNSLIRNETPGNSLVSQWLGLHALTGKSPDSTLDWGAKILQASRCCQKGRKEATLQMVGNIIKGLCDLEMVKFILSIKKNERLVTQMVKNLPAVQETRVQSLGWEDALEKGMATHSSILAWRIPWTEEPGGLL